MARYAVQNGNWSDTATWDGGTLPGPGDVVRPNNFTVTIDQDIEVAELRRDALAPAVAGGTFEVVSGDRLLDCNARAPVLLLNDASMRITGNAHCESSGVTFHRSSGHLRIDGDCIGGTSASQRGCSFEAREGGSLSVGGKSIGGTGVASSQGIIIQPPGGGLPTTGRSVFIAGDCQANVGHGLNVNSTQTDVVVGGDIIGDTNPGVFSGLTTSPASPFGKLTIFGSIVGSSTNADGAGLSVSLVRPFDVEIYGSLVGRLAPALSITRPDGEHVSAIVHGGATGGPQETGNGLFLSRDDAEVRIKGSSIGGSGAHGVLNTGDGTVIVEGNDVGNPSGFLGIANTGTGTIKVGPQSGNTFFLRGLALRNGSLSATLMFNANVADDNIVTGSPTYQITDVDTAQVVASGTLDPVSLSFATLLSPPLQTGRLYLVRINAEIGGNAYSDEQSLIAMR